MATDPVCGMQVDEGTAAGSSVFEGTTYYFCSKGCKAAFEKEPHKYVHDSDEPEGHAGHH